LAHAEGSRQKLDQRFVGATFDGRCREPNLVRAAVQSGVFGA